MHVGSVGLVRLRWLWTTGVGVSSVEDETVTFGERASETEDHQAAALDEHAALAQRMIPDVRRLAPQLVLAGVLPVVGYAILRPHVGSDATALAAVMVFPVLDVVVGRRRHGGFEPIGLVVLVGIVVGIASALLFHGNDTLLKLRESVLTGAFGLVCLASLAAPRPAMFFVGRMFATAGNPDARAQFDVMWSRPGAARRFRVVTAVWGIALVGEAGLRTVLAFTLPTERFLAIAPVIGWAVIGALVWYSTLATRAGEREVRRATEAAAQPD